MATVLLIISYEGVDLLRYIYIYIYDLVEHVML